MTDDDTLRAPTITIELIDYASNEHIYSFESEFIPRIGEEIMLKRRVFDEENMAYGIVERIINFMDEGRPDLSIVQIQIKIINYEQ